MVPVHAGPATSPAGASRRGQDGRSNHGASLNNTDKMPATHGWSPGMEEIAVAALSLSIGENRNRPTYNTEHKCPANALRQHTPPQTTTDPEPGDDPNR